jgi:hypothetical protein
MHVIQKVPLFHAVLNIALEAPKSVPNDYTKFTKRATFAGVRLGVPRELFFDVTVVDYQEILDAVDAAISKIKLLGAFIQDPADLPSAGFLLNNPAENIVLRILFLLR